MTPADYAWPDDDLRAQPRDMMNSAQSPGVQSLSGRGDASPAFA